MHPQTAEKERVLQPVETSFFGRLEGRVCHRLLQTSADQVSWNEDSPDLSRSFLGFVELVSNKAATNLKRSAIVAYSVHTVLLDFSKEHKVRLIQSKQNIVAFVPVETKKRGVVKEAYIGGPQE